jgi:hypothetical protein
LKEMLETLESKLKDQSWTEKEDAEFIKVLDDLTKAVHNLAVKTYIMAELIDTFYEGIVELFKEDDDAAMSISENGNVYPESNTNLS